ncbi:hypothetical protein ACFOVU_02290 [Nocardiopsis sediminis]|uniref:Ferric reductase n=1 Tax=Nocardiopsis sediminis TaxID=1778267 RepID=A0ABV8FJ70_9ACTN
MAAPNQVNFLRIVQDFLWTYSGVFALVGLTGAVVFGLAATDRLMATIHDRVWFQVVHRSAAIAAVGFLIAHITLQIAYGAPRFYNAVVPIGLDASVLFGVLASDLLLFIIATGVFRSSFVGMSRPWMWRALHVSAYVCWPMAMVHGLTAGRTPAWWVILGYTLCMLAVATMLVLRMVVSVPERSAEPEPEPEEKPERTVTVVRNGMAEAPAEPQPAMAEDAEFWATIRGGSRSS